MNNLLAEGALKALTAKGFETKSGFCSRFGRQVCEYVYGDSRYDKYWRTDADPTAREAGLAFQKAGFGVPKTQLQYGDILFKTTGDYGHIGFYTDSGVAENSSYHWNRHPGDARGLRSLAQFGTFQIAIRLPSPVAVAPIPNKPVVIEKPLLIWNNLPFPMVLVDERVFVQFESICEHVNQTVYAMNNRLAENPPRYYVNSKPDSK